jgi:hypothetical protein
MKPLISGVIFLLLLGAWLSPVHASRPGGKLPEVFKMVNDENFYMTFDGKTLFISPQKDAELQYSCKVRGKFPQISYSGEYTVQGPYHYKDPGVAARIMPCIFQALNT